MSLTIQTLDAQSRDRAREAVEPLFGSPGFPNARPTRANIGHRSPSGPALHLEDISAIPFVDGVPGIEEYQHRARVRAGDGDLFAAVTPSAPGYERYCAERLGLGSPTFINPPPGPRRLAVAEACAQGATFATLAQTAADAGGLAIHPYMAIESVWALAQRLEEASGAPVGVIGPPPEVLWVANDKDRFSQVVRAVLGEPWLVETVTGTDPGALTEAVLALASKHRRVGLKRTRCASAMGNEVFDASDVSERPQARARVERFLERTEWPQGEEVLAVAWEETDLSPSTQLWIPPDGQGAPVVEGVYEQLLEGPEKVFLGSRPSTLPVALNDTLARASLAIAEAFQLMGYVGRCSFDFIVVGSPEDDPRVLLTECNGRWGGTSTPMRLMDRLFPQGRPHYVAQDIIHPALVGATLDDLLAKLGEAAFDVHSGSGKFVFYNVGPLARKGKLDVIAVGDDPQSAWAALREELPRLLGL